MPTEKAPLATRKGEKGSGGKTPIRTSHPEGSE